MALQDAVLQEMVDEFALRRLVHHITTMNFVIDGNAAEGEIYSIAIHTFTGKGRDVDVIVAGRYLDKYEKRRGTWKFVERTVVADWARVDDPSAMNMSHPITRDSLKGTLDSSDPSFGFFSLLNGPVPE